MSMERKIKKCLRCAAEFPCGPASEKEPCWCASLPAVMPMSEAGCLCPKCLKEEIARRLAERA